MIRKRPRGSPVLAPLLAAALVAGPVGCHEMIAPSGRVLVVVTSVKETSPRSRPDNHAFERAALQTKTFYARRGFDVTVRTVPTVGRALHLLSAIENLDRLVLIGHGGYDGPIVQDGQIGIADDRKTFPARLEAYLREYDGGNRNIQVINAGVPGYTSIEVFMRYVFKVQPLDPDLVIYYFTHNDVHPRRFPTMGRDYAEYSRPWCEPPRSLRQRIPWAFRMVVHGTDDWLAGHKAEDIGNVVRRYAEQPRRHSSNVLRNPSNIFHDNVRNLALLAKGWGAKMMILTPPYREIDPQSGASVSENPVFRAVYDHAAAAQRIADKMDFPCYQLARHIPYDDLQKPPNEYFIDWVHFSEKGAELVAGLVGRKILDLDLIA